MQYEASTVEHYIEQIPEDRKLIFRQIIDVIETNLPSGFNSTIGYGMINWVVPLETYPEGYHCTSGSPLPFLALASQKNFIALYHMGMYAEKNLLEWFVSEYPKYSKRKLDMGKSCVRFKKMDDIPLELLGQLAQKMTVENWITIYEQNFKK